MLEIIGQTVGTIILVVLVGAMLYGFYFLLKYMLDNVRKHDDE